MAQAVGPFLADTITSFRKTVAVAGTSEKIITAQTSNKGVYITAETDNTGLIAVGGSTVAAATGSQQGTILGAGDIMGFAISDLSNVYIDSTVNGDGVTVTYFN